MARRCNMGVAIEVIPIAVDKFGPRICKSKGVRSKARVELIAVHSLCPPLVTKSGGILTLARKKKSYPARQLVQWVISPPKASM